MTIASGELITATDVNAIVSNVATQTARIDALLLVGEATRELNSYRPISAAFPWLCLALPSQTLSNSNFTQEFLDVLRARLLTYDEMGVSPITSFGGAWGGGGGRVFTLTNNAQNVALITALSEDYLLAGTFTAFRILHDGTTEYEIIGLDAAARTITVNAGTPSGVSISIYLNRVYGSTTSARHHTQAGLSNYQCGGTEKLNGLRRLDAMQQITGTTSSLVYTVTFTASGALSYTEGGTAIFTAGGTGRRATLSFDSANSSGSRTGTETRAKSGTSYKYLYVGVYTV